MRAWTTIIAALFVFTAPFAASGIECDFDACTQGDQCQDGVCVPGDLLDCGSDPCVVASCSDGQCEAKSKCPPAFHPCRGPVTCNPISGECETEPTNIGGACDDDLTNCLTGTCDDSGECIENIPQNDVPCGSLGECAGEGVCIAGSCLRPILEDGTPCSLGNACIPSQCQSGFCLPSGQPEPCPQNPNLCETHECNPQSGECEPITTECVSADECSGEGVCNPTTGACEFDNPIPDGTSCDDNNFCTAGDQCTAGTCTGTPIDDPSMAPVASNSSLIALAAVLAILPAIGLATRRRHS